MKLGYFFDENFKVYKFKGILDEKIILYNGNFRNHIKVSHPEMTLNKIKEISVDPDYIYKSSRNSKTRYYEKNYKGTNYRVVVDRKKYNINNKNHTYEVVTAYEIGSTDHFTVKHIHCIYDRKLRISYEEKMRQIQEDKYYYELFGVLE